MKNLGRLLLIALVVSMAAPVYGALIIDFGTGLAGAGGTFNLLSGGNASGIDIPIGVMTVVGSGAKDGTYTVGGTCSGSGQTNVGCLNFNTSTNTLSVVGGLTGLGIGSSTLLTGSFTSWLADANGLTSATGPDTKSATLLSALGVSSPPYKFAYFGFSLAADGSGSSVISTDIKNTGTVPEPATLSLMGFGLVAVALVGRRFRRS
jgi:hypothetical protein